jgi:hypothetical protein
MLYVQKCNVLLVDDKMVIERTNLVVGGLMRFIQVVPNVTISYFFRLLNFSVALFTFSH